MGVFKEEAITFETVAKNQKQIYRDSADFGYPYNTKNIPAEIQSLIDSVHHFSSIDRNSKSDGKPFIRKRFSWGYGVEVVIRIAWEMDEGFYCGTEYTISFNKTPNDTELINKNCNAFISVNIKNYRERV